MKVSEQHERIEKDMKENIEEQRKRLEQTKERLKSRTEERLNRQSIIHTLIVVIPAVIAFFAIDIIVRYRIMGEMHPVDVIPEFGLLIPICAGLAILVYLLNKKSKADAAALSKGLERAADGDLEVRLDTSHAGALSDAFEDFNVMCERLGIMNARMEEAVREAEKASAAKSDFLSSMSHEIRTPLNAVLGLDEMIVRESTEPQIQDYAIEIESSGKTLLGLINDILDFSKIESGKLELISAEYEVSSVVNDLLNMIEKKARDKGLEFKVSVNQKLPHCLYGDEIRLKQIILNILSNAVKYTDKGTVTMSVNYEKEDADSIALKVRVADTGKGIRQEDIEKLFAPFERIEENKNRSIEGTGLGMSITKKLLAMMDSQLEVSSVYGKGSIFSFSVKQKVTDWNAVGDFRAAYQQVKEGERIYHESFHAPSARILVVDDTPVNMTMFRGLLKKTQIQIDTAESGKACLALAAKSRYHIIFIDHLMPDMGGIETLHHLQEDDDSVNVGVPMIALTANALSGAREMYLGEGFTDYLAKPIDGIQLEQMIRQYLPAALVEPAVQMTEDRSKSEKESPLAELRKIAGIDTEAGIQACGTEDIYLNVVKEFYPPAAKQADLIETYYTEKDYHNYTIQVHSLKSSARLIGALALSEQAKKLEACGNAEDQITIEAETPALLQTYRIYAAQLQEIFEDPDADADKPLIEEKMLREAMGALREAAEAFDFDSADAFMEQLLKYRMPDSFRQTYQELKTLMAEVARDDIIRLIDGYLSREEH